MKQQIKISLTILFHSKKAGLLTALLMFSVLMFSQNTLSDTEQQKVNTLEQEAENSFTSGNFVEALNTYNELANIYNQHKDFAKVEHYYKKALSAAQKQSAQYRTVSAYFRLINVLKIQKKWNEALKYEEEKITLTRNTGNKKKLVNDLINIAYTLKMLKRYEEAIVKLEEAKKIAQFELKNEQLALTCYKELANNYKLLGNDEKYNEYYNLVERITTEKTTADLKNKTQEAINNVKIKEQQLQETSSRLNIVTDSLSKMEAIARMQEAELALKKALIDNQKMKIAQQEAELKMKRLVIYFLISIFLLALLASILWYIQYKKKREALAEVQTKNEEISQQKEEIQAQAEELEFQRDELYRSNKTKEKLLSVVAHDLKNPIHALIGFSELLVDENAGLTEEEKLQYAEYIHDSSLQILNLLENLLKWAQSQSSSIKYQPELFDINELLDVNVKLFNESAKKKQISIVYQGNAKSKVYGDKNMLNTVIRNLINNAIKFTAPGGKILTSSTDKEDFVEVQIVDTGVGMSNEVIDKILNSEEFHSSAGTQNEQGTGLGLAICKEFLNLHQSELQIQSRPGKGSTFYFKIPVNNVDSPAA